MYAPGMGRFLTRDTWGGAKNQPMSYNSWLYAYENPINLTDPSGFNPHCLNYHRDLCAQQRFYEIVAKDPFTAGKNLLTLVALFEDQELQTLWGTYAGRTVSKRLEWILHMTNGFPVGDITLPFPGAQFAYSDLFGTNDCYFSSEFRDNQFYQNEWKRPNSPSYSNQVGHFLTGVSLAYKNVFYLSEEVGIMNTGNLDLMIAHEKVTDHTYDPITNKQNPQIFAQIKNAQVTDQDVINFMNAIAYDDLGMYNERDQSLWNILNFGNNVPVGGADPNREGNSLQDLRLDVRAWRFAWWVRGHSGLSSSSGGAWLRSNLMR